MKPISVTSYEARSPKTFSLIPYPAPDIPAIEITGRIVRQDTQLSVRYIIRGDTDSILLPVFCDPVRKDDLWKATCFEFFLATPGLPGYWEFNLSPSGEWNVYTMDAYRRVNFSEETSFSNLPFEFKKGDHEYSLDISVDLTPIAYINQNIQIGITAVIQTKSGNETLWALVHPGALADFHLRESFIIVID